MKARCMSVSQAGAYRHRQSPAESLVPSQAMMTSQCVQQLARQTRRVRRYDYSMSLAPEGREGLFTALASAPLFAAKLPTGAFLILGSLCLHCIEGRGMLSGLVSQNTFLTWAQATRAYMYHHGIITAEIPYLVLKLALAEARPWLLSKRAQERRLSAARLLQDSATTRPSPDRWCWAPLLNSPQP